jgi:hypothetical protein
MTNKIDKKQAKQPKKSQHDLFKEAAKAAECSEKFDLKEIIKKLPKTNKSSK